MANKKLFGAQHPATRVAPADTRNLAGGPAYKLGAEEALAQLAVTGTFNPTFYGTAVGQLEAVKLAADQVSPDFLARCALYARRKGGMKDMPAALLVMLCKADPALADRVFDRVVDNGKQLRNFVQMTSSGKFGRNRFSGSAPKRLVARWLNRQTPASLLRASVGNDPTLAQIIRLAHPKPKDDERRALYGWLRGHEAGEPGLGEDEKPRYRASDLPKVVQELLAFRSGAATLPDVDFRFLAGLPLTSAQWGQLALRGGVVQTFKNLNTYARHQALGGGVAEALAAKLRDREAVAKARVFPYQLLAAYMNLDPEVPSILRDALQDALDASALDAEGAAHLVRDTLPGEDELMDSFAFRRWRVR